MVPEGDRRPEGTSAGLMGEVVVGLSTQMMGAHSNPGEEAGSSSQLRLWGCQESDRGQRALRSTRLGGDCVQGAAQSLRRNRAGVGKRKVPARRRSLTATKYQ